MQPKTPFHKQRRWPKSRFHDRTPDDEDLRSLAVAFCWYALIVALAFALVGCGTPTAHLVVYDDREGGPVHELAELPDTVAAACDLLPVGCSAGPFEQTGTVDVHLWPDGMRRGRMLGGRPCWRAIGARASDPVAIAHELGHAFGLDDVDAPGRLMDYSACGVDADQRWGEVLTEDEVDQILRNAGALEACQ